ncbi:MAG: ATP-binding protein [Pseudonocardia sp.]|nr:ATP-binding protein [Pseudonocardia sp.]
MTVTWSAPGDTPGRALPVPGASASRPPAPVRLQVPGRALVLVAGVPGAGKSTLLRLLPARPGQRVLDSETQRELVTGLLPDVSYPRLRPLVHLLHRLAVVAAAAGPARTVLLHLPATSRGLRSAVRLLARLTGRTAHLVWIEVEPQDALRGQAERGRMIESRSFARHAARAEGVADRIRTGGLGEGWSREVALDRRAAARGLELHG